MAAKGAGNGAEESVQFVASYIEEIFVADDIFFLWYQDSLLKRPNAWHIPYDFTGEDLPAARYDYEECLSHEYPGRALVGSMGNRQKTVRS